MDFLEGQGKEGPFTVTKFEKYSKRLEVFEMVEKCTDFCKKHQMGLFWLFSKAVGVFLDLFKRVLGSEAENALAFLVVLLQTESNIFCLFHTWLHY